MNFVDVDWLMRTVRTEDVPTGRLGPVRWLFRNKEACGAWHLVKPPF